MYGIYVKFVSKYLFFSPFSYIPPFLVFSIAFSLAIVINVEVAKINTDFLPLSSFFEMIC